MKKSNSTKKALGAFKKLGVVVLITATMFFTACNQAGGGGGEKPKPAPKPKHAITFSVEGGNGTLKAKADGVDETSTSPINVEEGKTVTFTAKASDGYRVKGWTLDGKAVNGSNNSYLFTVSKAVSVKVSFEATPPAKYTVTLNQTSNGTVTASSTIPQDGVDKDTEITFTATANPGYRVNTWTVSPNEAIKSGGGKGETTATLKITANTTVSVSFEEIPKHNVTFSVEGGNGTLKAKADGVDETAASPITVEEDKTVTFTATPATGHRVKEWKVGDTVVKGNKTNTYTHTVKKAVTVTVSFEAIPDGAILTLAADKNVVGVWAKTADNSAITVVGCTVDTLDSENQRDLTANENGGKITLKGNIIELSVTYIFPNKGPLTALDVSGLATLQKLSCGDNQLTSLNASGLTALKEINCYSNKLTSLNVQGCTALQKLACSSNELPELNVKGLTQLQKLECSNNKLTALDVQGLAVLKNLHCNQNNLTSLNVKDCTALEELDCRGNQLPELDVQGLTKLKNLECPSNKLGKLDVHGLTELKNLYCDENQLTELNVKDCTALKFLNCSSNKLNAKAMKALLNALPQREENDNANATLYIEDTSKPEGNHKDFKTDADLKAAFDGAKSKNWKLKKETADDIVDI